MVLHAPSISYFNDGGPGDVAFDRPLNIVVDVADNIYVVDRFQGVARKAVPSDERTCAPSVLLFVPPAYSGSLVQSSVRI